MIQTGKKRKKYQVSSESAQLRKRLEYQKTTDELLAKFDTEEKCEKYLFSWKWPEGYRCPHHDRESQLQCGHAEYYIHKQRHLYQCKKCGHQTSVTAGTMFEKTRTSLHEWFKLIILVVRKHRPSSIRRMKNELGIESYDRALRMIRKIESALLGNGAYEQFFGLFNPDVLRLKRFMLEKPREMDEKKNIYKAVDCLIRDFRRMNVKNKLSRKKKKSEKRGG